MSNTGNTLDGMVSAYTDPVIDAPLVRQLLRVLRKRSFSSSRKAAVKAKLDPSTVAKIENLKTWPNYDPGIGIVLKLLTALQMPFESFASELNTVDQKFDGKLPKGYLQNRALPLPSLSVEDQLGSPLKPVVLDDAQIQALASDERLQDALYRSVGEQIARAYPLRAGELQSDRESPPDPRPEQPASGRRPRAHHRRHVKRLKKQPRR